MERQHQNHMEHSNREPCPCLWGNAFMVPQKGEGRKTEPGGSAAALRDCKEPTTHCS